MTSNKRQRQLARAKHERQQARRAAEQARRRRITTIFGAVVGVLIVAVAMIWLLRATSGSSSTAASPTPPVPTTVAPTTAAPTSPGATSPGATSPAPTSPAPTSPSPTGSGSPTAAPIACKGTPPVRADDKTWPSAPPQTIKPVGTYTMTFATNCGNIVLTLDQAKAPITTNSMVFLTDQKYFDLTACHRLTTDGIYVLQCGDPKGDGTGGPGYTVPDENLPADTPNNYPAGTVAMANAGPGTAGSQFFIVYRDTTLPPAYTIWGQVTSGLNLVQEIAAAGVQGGGTDGAPAQPVVIEKATVAYSEKAS